MLATLILAAGTSSRYGNGINKLLLPFGESTVVAQVLNKMRAIKTQQVVVVTGHQVSAITASIAQCQLRATQTLTLAHNAQFQTGEMLSSIKCGVKTLREKTPQATSVMITLGDQPLLDVALTNHLIELYENKNNALVAPRYHGQRGHPVIIGQKYWDELLQLPHGKNVRDLLAHHPEDLFLEDVETETILMDCDTPQAYNACLKYIASPSPLSPR
jgi:molybdenum cofactor cytidylyltransferase